jgi:multidrug resistance efflux pump
MTEARFTPDQTAPDADAATSRQRMRVNPRAVIAAIIFLAIIGLAIWYLARPEPLLLQGEVESTRADIAARVSSRLVKVPVKRRRDAAGATLLVIDNPRLVAQQHEAEAEKLVADAELARINVGTRAEIIAQRRAGIDRAVAARDGIHARIAEIIARGELTTWRAARVVGDHDLNTFLVRADPVEAAAADLQPGMTVWLEPASRAAR